MKNIGILVASVNKNMGLALKIQEVVIELEAKSEVINLVALDLPMYTSIIEDKHGIPAEVKTLAKHLQTFDALIVVSPEYNGRYATCTQQCHSMGLTCRRRLQSHLQPKVYCPSLSLWWWRFER